MIWACSLAARAYPALRWLVLAIGALSFAGANAHAAPRSVQHTPTPTLTPTPTPESKPPNIILILADDLGYGELGCYGQLKIRTPNLDRMAAQGVRFTRAYASAPVCAPTRAMLLTGLHSGHAVIRDNVEMKDAAGKPVEGQAPFPAGTATLASALKKLGYATGVVGKWGNGGPGSTGEPQKMGFDFAYGFLCQRQAHNSYPTHLWRNGVREELAGNKQGNLTGAQYVQDLFLKESIAFMEQSERPFFLFLPFTIPHVALQNGLNDLAHYANTFPETPYDGGRGYLKHATPRAAYAAMISRLDADIGVLLQRLKQLGIQDNTLVMFTSDNGPTHDVGGVDTEFFGSAGGLKGRKGSVWEGGIRVPLIAMWPGKIPAGRVSEHPCASHDLFATIVEVAGGSIPAGIDGISMAPSLIGRGEQRVPHHMYWEFPGYGGQQAVIMGKWKGVRRDMAKGNTRIQLFDLQSDPQEATDVAEAQPTVVAEIRALMESSRTPNASFPLPGGQP